MNYLTVEAVAERSFVVSGELDMASEPHLRTALEEILATDGPVELDLAAVTFIDSTGTRVIIDAAVALRDRGGLTVTRPSPAVVRVFELFGMLPENPAIPLNVQWDPEDAPRGGPGAISIVDAEINRSVEARLDARELRRTGSIVPSNRTRRTQAADGLS